ncbi:ubiquinone biosynthesis regulatory protein kinase UbiB [Oceanospirillum sanctuarii]|uniref:ubiquinone biosynthesis regulatory protein kinase UbiB n=1 Tax=Oceanospirillum sanctuarii TaxID=1434821 RepID=UPI000A3749EC|nr:ubiquinone biosynthesis regulatory protein kinase UbiB [Oceanospirillum sanctuarii]
MSRLLRLFKIIFVFSRYRLDSLIPEDRLPWFAVLLLRLNPMRILPVGKKSRGERLRLALEELGPIFIKFGQMLSTRRDLLPDDVADELKKLQDQVPPFASHVAVKEIETALGMSVGELFKSFEREPMASASMAQVHAAQLNTGEQVVVKVIRPGIRKVLKKDVKLLYTLAYTLNYWVPEARRLHPVAIVKDYESTLFDELDLQKEAANTSQLRRNFEGSPALYVPQVYWEMTRRNVMVQERIYGIPVAEVDALIANGTDMKKLAERGVEVFFTQVFRDNFFHADMHPGNIFISEKHPHDPQYIGIDCGIVGSLSEEDQHYLARNLLAFFRQDYYEVARLHIESGWVGEGTRVNEFATAIRSVCEPIFEKPLKEISFGQVLLGLFQTARRFNMEVQPQLVLLQKTLLNIEGLGRQLYPDLDLWSTAKPYLENWMKQRMGPKGVWKNIRSQFPDWMEQAPELPNMVYGALDQIRKTEERQLRQEALLQELVDSSKTRSKKKSSSLGWLLLLSGVFVASDGLPWLQQLPAEAQALMALGVFFLVRR